MRLHVPTLHSLPKQLEGQYRECMGTILSELGRGIRARDDLQQERAWKPLVLSSRLLLYHENLQPGATRAESLQCRFEMFRASEWNATLPNLAGEAIVW